MAKNINLIMPKHWNQCTTEQLEQIASVMLELIQKQDRYHPFSMWNVKVAVFFILAGIEIAANPDSRLPVKEQFFLCRFNKKRKWYQCKGSGETFPVYLWQINYWLSPKARTDDNTSVEYITQGAGMLDWLDNEKSIFLTKFPYPVMRRHKMWRIKNFQGVFLDLDGFSWAQYRFASDMMQSYTKISNNLIRMRQMNKFSDTQVRQQAESVDSARAMFLATIFNAKTKYVDSGTGMIRHDFHYESNQFAKNAIYFRHFPDYQWQVILFWWTGVMHTLSKRYPHVFKVQSVRRRQQPSTPLEIYTATTATMQKYAGLTEEQVNNQSYSLVLEHLERLAKENEELERIRKSK